MSRRLALLIATYEHQDPGLRRLTAPAHDVEALAAVLRDPEIAGFEVRTLVNEPHHRVGEAVAGLFEGRRTDDLVLLYFTGHGLKDEDGRLYLAMRNTRRESPLFTSLPTTQIHQALSDCVSRRKVLILDCCYSGAYPEGHLPMADDGVHTFEQFHGSGQIVLTASDAIRYAFEGDRLSGSAVQSVFTRHLVEGLREGSADLDGDGNITMDKLYRYVHDRVIDEMPQQRPMMRDSVEGRIVIARNVNWSLPAHLGHALASPLAAERLSALEVLDHLRRQGNEVVRAKVEEEIARLAADDSRLVSQAAERLLGGTGTRTPVAVPRPSGVGTGAMPVGSQPGGTSTGAAPAGSQPGEVGAGAALLGSQPGGADTRAPVALAQGDPPVATGAGRRRLPALRLPTPRLPRHGRPSRDWWPTAASIGLQRLRARTRALNLRALCGGSALLAAALTVGALLQRNEAYPRFSSEEWGSITWYLAGLAGVALAGGVCTLVPRTGALTGPGLVLGAATASLCGLVYFAGSAAGDPHAPDAAIPSGLAAHAALLAAACLALAALIRNPEVRFDLRPPRALWSYVVVGTACGVAVVGALAGVLLLDESAGLREFFDYPDLALSSHAFVVVVVALAVAAATWARFTSFYQESLGNVALAAGALVALLLLTTVLARWARTAERPVARPRGRVLVAALVVLPLLAGSAGAVVDVRLHRARVVVQPLDLVLSPDGDRFYVVSLLRRASQEKPEGLSGEVTVLDPATGRTTGRRTLLVKAANDAALTRDGRYLYLAQPYGGTVTVVATEEMEPFGDPLRLSGRPSMIHTTGDRAWVAGTPSGAWSSIDTKNVRLSVRTVTPGKGWQVAAVNNDGTRIYTGKGSTVTGYGLAPSTTPASTWWRTARTPAPSWPWTRGPARSRAGRAYR
ncbi:caspase family protein [Streptomyces sp. Ag109_G2-15]|uniref:caspase, EACC1-associated type n=1 Tax=Streptomyces sp. Ag109_G2-15 TaxID=1938850 RepID=UPI000BC7A0B3|nr:caspase family protein [Streptomyces sp. Ag109_G2-15]SOE08215.1 Caspase domain-containing protein [Streptomyces sp. Ag109_G2-15]